jgi:large subunit ribosomal protein L4
LLVVAETDHNICLSVRNLPKVKVMQVANLNTYDVMNAGVMLFTESAVAKVNEMF